MYLFNDKEKTKLVRPLAQAEKPCKVIFIIMWFLILKIVAWKFDFS